jgi:hypothetical protein
VKKSCTVEDSHGRSLSFSADRVVVPHKKIRVRLDAAGRDIADKFAKMVRRNAQQRRGRLKYGFEEDGDAAGSLAEVVAMAALNITKWNTHPQGIGSGHKPTDIGQTIQVRSTPHPRGCHLLIYEDEVEELPDKPYVFVSVDLEEGSGVVHGWCTAHAATFMGEWKKPSKKDACFWVRQSQLIALSELDELPEDVRRELNGETDLWELAA